jgi:hypothetical protein
MAAGALFRSGRYLSTPRLKLECSTLGVQAFLALDGLRHCRPAGFDEAGMLAL